MHSFISHHILSASIWKGDNKIWESESLLRRSHLSPLSMPPCAPTNWQRMEIWRAVWLRIVKAVEELLAKERPDDAEVH